MYIAPKSLNLHNNWLLFAAEGSSGAADVDGIASANPETIERVKREAAAVLNDSFFARLDDVKQVQ